MFDERSHTSRPECGSNSLDPHRMTAAERLREVGEILAAGLLRLRAKQGQLSDDHDLSLDFPAHQSVHGRKRKPREKP
jgi:hypothetical protein